MQANDAPGRYDLESTHTAEEPVDVRVRRRLRELRAERGLTLQQVAERANIDVSTLSRLESGKRRLALDHIASLAAALGVSTDQLFGATHPSDPRVRGRPKTFDDMTMWPLTQHGPAGLQVFKITVSAKRNTPPATMPVHDGHEWIYVLDGKLKLILGETEHLIDAGEAVEFSTTLPHWFGSADGPVDLIAFFSAHGRRVHLEG